ncbi:B3 domain-containing protein [Artemisia annua]|uniref:B3 domain-containing protein n=1 Tax=Artemisia annua TaxID=35608 RepID=A0A2U1QFE1_ARTAN|nr:B3 domain-containing protein [Artemisia annua]
MGDSLKIKPCFNCKDSSSVKLMNGWKDSTGEYVPLCYNCCSIYKAGQFCEMFHSDEDGWRDCESCKQLIHCGCIVSLSDYMMHDSGGITCNKCSDTNSLLGRDCSNDESHSTDVTDLTNDTDLKSVLTPLFEKVVSTTDSNLKTSRMRIPRNYATAHFPEVTGTEVVPLNIIDTDGKEWGVYFRCWPHYNKATYVMTGLKDFYVSKNLQAGDTVAFYRRDTDGKIVMELRKPSDQGPVWPCAK